MKKLVAAFAVALLMPWGIAYACSKTCSGTMQARIIKSGAAISVAGWHGDHAWADSWNSGADYMENKAGGTGADYCGRLGSASACSQYYRSWLESWGGSECTSYSFAGCQYSWGIQITYGSTGVCHQGANRANSQYSSVPWAKDTAIGGAGTSTALWCECGAAGPGGWCWSC